MDLVLESSKSIGPGAAQIYAVWTIANRVEDDPHRRLLVELAELHVEPGHELRKRMPADDGANAGDLVTSAIGAADLVHVESIA